MQAHQLERTYLAVTHGAIQPGYADRIEAALRVDDDLVRLASEADAATIQAATNWRCLGTSGKFSLIELAPETGRKHQLRVHCAEVLRAPIVGDHKYTLASLIEGLDDARKLLPPDTMLLHAHTLGFHAYDKESGKRSDVLVRAPLPSAFTKFCQERGLELPTY
jgi:23S rRNA-/tRNA-specific pseudouridylate synthase